MPCSCWEGSGLGLCHVRAALHGSGRPLALDLLPPGGPSGPDPAKRRGWGLWPLQFGRHRQGGLGHEVQVEHIKAYLTKSPVDAGKAVVVIQDIFGWQLPNTRYMADMIAGNGYTYV